MREPLAHRLDRVRDARITPACAGTTLRQPSDVFIAWDHPRVCGNHYSKALMSLVITGSPPRVREPLATAIGNALGVRITPACAGTTADSRRPLYGFEDHPRVCGNHFRDIIRNSMKRGSPPRVREPLVAGIATIVVLRITPACAGTTHSASDASGYVEDHPRVCGNHKSDAP